MVCLLSFLLVQGLVDEFVRHQGSVSAGKVSDALSLSQQFLLPFNQLHVGTRLDRHAVFYVMCTTNTTTNTTQGSSTLVFPVCEGRSVLC